jgi:hypothetical protein
MAEINFNALKVNGKFVSPAKFDAVVDVLQRVTLQPSAGFRITRTLHGTTLTPKAGANGSAPCPLSIGITPISGDSSNISVNVSPGTVGGLVPSNLFDTFTVSKTDTVYVKATASSDGASVTSVSLSADTDTPTAQTPAPFALPSSCEILLGLIQSGRAYRTIDCGSVALVGQAAFAVDKTSPADPGQSTTTDYYLWAVSSF